MKQPDETKNEMNDLQNLNPQIVDFEIGVRNLRKIKVFPLSVGDEMKMTQLLSQTVAAFLVTKEAQNEVALITFFINLFHNNLEQFISLVIGEKADDQGKYKEAQEILGDMTNNQVSALGLLIFEVNFESSLKNFKDLFEKVSGLFPSERLPQELRNVIDTRLEKSSEPPLEKEESPEDN